MRISLKSAHEAQVSILTSVSVSITSPGLAFHSMHKSVSVGLNGSLCNRPYGSLCKNSKHQILAASTNILLIGFTVFTFSLLQ